MTIRMDEYEDWYKQPWKEVGLTEEQWVKPLSELSEEHRKVIFDVYNMKFGLKLSPATFHIKSNPKQTATESPEPFDFDFE